ncbi:MAG: phage tail tape measure protein, partial [Pseudomonadota bacterium]
MVAAVVGALRVTLGLDSAAFSKGAKQATSRLQSFAKTAAKGLAGIGVAAGAAAAGVGVAVRGVLNDADNLAKVSRQIGVPVEELSRLRHAADLSGVSFSNLQTGVRRLSQNMNDAANGIGEGKEAFDALGIEVTKADGTLKSTTEIMAEMSDAFAGLPDGAQKTALALDLMGRSGAQMIPLLNDGSDSLRSMMAEADALGITITEKTAKSAEVFNDNLNRLSKAFSSLGVQISADLAPVLADFTDWLVSNAPA